MKKLFFVFLSFFALTAFTGFNQEDFDALSNDLNQAKEENTVSNKDKVIEQIYGLMKICMKSESYVPSFNKDLRHLLDLCRENNYKVPTKILWAASTCKYNEKLFKTLIEYGNINVNYYNSEEIITPTPLLRFINYWPDVVHLLLIKGADANKPNSYGTTPLMWAANSEEQEKEEFIENKKAIIDDLIAFGAITNTPDNRGRYALDYAKNREINKYLRHKMVDNINLKH